MPIVPTEKTNSPESAVTLCAACGAGFSCGVNDGECWCFAVAVATETLAAIGEKYENCLCRKCLDEQNSSSSSPEQIKFEKTDFSREIN